MIVLTPSKLFVNANVAGMSVEPDSGIDEALLAHLFRREKVATVENNRRFHLLFDQIEIEISELVPFGHDRQCVRVFKCVVLVCVVLHAVAEFWTRVEAQRKRPLRMVGMLGWWAVLRFLAGRLTLAEAIAHLIESDPQKDAILKGSGIRGGGSPPGHPGPGIPPAGDVKSGADMIKGGIGNLTGVK